VSKAFGVIRKQQYFTMMTNCTDIIHINNENKKGPRMLPWGTPDSTGKKWEL